ncbi:MULTISPECIES: hypothetical protein [unclassified Kaistella]|uniref:hypothetical protein n=1 Tax=unclassified Kaistella TaxID=2762626 RepID=UPI002734DE65|nr:MULTISPECIES: hypothetical protein [unclassified Kaistella]MDP2455144.1 hypothetical protein [Kaistella sp. SH11-4b]MDP2458051.1 hypothetical protein [Kaistella sp. SH40-3]MDP2461018.1 hypothetical protein [Kaistella sp. SH19-2b]
MKIKGLGIILPQLKNYHLEKYNFENYLINTNAEAIIKDPKYYDQTPAKNDDENLYQDFSVATNTEDLVPVNLIVIKVGGSAIFNRIKKALNTYLIKNKGSVADFNLMQDVVNRNVETEEDEISHGINIPLYLGLMGTMLGIIVGLINLTLSDNSKGDSFDPSAFLIGVAIAMSASFLGLLFTVLNNNAFKDSKKNMELNKNDFYTFLQTELMPVVNASVSNAVYTLKDVVVGFNKDFSVNLSVLRKLFDKSYKSLEGQASILDKMEEMDIKQFAAANVKILKELSNATEKIHSFQLYVDSLNTMMSETNKATISIRELLSGVNNFSDLAVKLEQRVDESGQLLQFATEHIAFLKDNSSQVKSLSNDFTDFTEKSMKTLENVSSDVLTNFRKFAEDESEILKNSIQSRPDQFEKLNHLDRLESIEKAILDNNINIIELGDQKLVEQHNRLIKALGEVESSVRNIKISLGKDTNLLPEDDRTKMISLVEAQMDYLQSNAITRLFPYNGKKKK